MVCRRGDSWLNSFELCVDTLSITSVLITDPKYLTRVSCRPKNSDIPVFTRYYKIFTFVFLTLNNSTGVESQTQNLIKRVIRKNFFVKFDLFDDILKRHWNPFSKLYWSGVSRIVSLLFLNHKCGFVIKQEVTVELSNCLRYKTSELCILDWRKGLN